MLKISRWTSIHDDALEMVVDAVRNPMSSWDRSDSEWRLDKESGDFIYKVGPKDLELMHKLAMNSTEHPKFRRMMPVWLDIYAPLYWWKQFDTYKVGTAGISTSTMHTIHKVALTMDDFATESLMKYNGGNCGECPLVLGKLDQYSPMDLMQLIIDMLNKHRVLYLETRDKRYWDQLIQLLPDSYIQMRTEMVNYEVLAKIYRERSGHKLGEWKTFCDWIEILPYFNEIIWIENVPYFHEIIKKGEEE